MDHIETREQLELAAAEPSGLERLMAGDTPMAAAVAGHLAGCADCTQELGKLRRTSLVLHDIIATELAPDLRERTLAYVRDVGRPRGAGGASREGTGGGSLAEPATGPVSLEERPRRRRRRLAAWVASIAAAVIVSATVTAAIVGGRPAERPTSELAQVANLSATVAAAQDAQTIRLAAAPGAAPLTGSVVFSATMGQLVVVSKDLVAPASGTEFRCWLEVDGKRVRIGKMFFEGGLAYWAGPVDWLTGVVPGTRFGVSLEDQAGSSNGGAPVLVGTL